MDEGASPEALSRAPPMSPARPLGNGTASAKASEGGSLMVVTLPAFAISRRLVFLLAGLIAVASAL
jgi:hypothetical protein